MGRILTFTGGDRSPGAPHGAAGFDLGAYYDAIGVVREAAHRLRFDADAGLLEDLATLETLLTRNGEPASEVEGVSKDEALPHLLARLRRDLSGASRYRVEPDAVELEEEDAPEACDPEDLARLEALLAMAERFDSQAAAIEDAEILDMSDPADAAAASEPERITAEPEPEPEIDEIEAEAEAEADEAAPVAQTAASPAEQLAEAAAGSERENAALLSAISAGRLAIVFDRRRSAVLAAQADAAGCAPEDVVVTGLDWYLDALSRG